MIQDGLGLIDLRLGSPKCRSLGQIVRPLHPEKPPQIPLSQLSQGFGHALLCAGDIPVMPRYQPYHCLPGGVVRPQAPEHLLRHGGAHCGMSVEMAVPLRIFCKAFWLSNIMKEHSQPQFRLRRHSVQSMKGMLPHIVAVVDIVLGKPYHPGNLRPEHPHYIGKSPQHGGSIHSCQQSQQLLPDTLRGDLPQQFPARVQPLGRAILNRKFQHSRKPHAPEDPQGVLAKALPGLTHTPQYPPPQVVSPSKGIPQLSPAIHCHSIDGEVPPSQILLQGAGKANRFRPPVIPVRAIYPEGGHLDGAGLCPHSDGAVAKSRGNCLLSEEVQGLLRQGVGGNIPILRSPPQEAVPHAAAHTPCLMSCRLQHFHDPVSRFWNFQDIIPLISVAFLFFPYYNKLLNDYTTHWPSLQRGKCFERKFRFMMNNPNPIRDYLVPGKRAHLVGIGGVSMCPLAEVLQGMGLRVQGSDMTDSDTVKHLRSMGIPVSIGHNADNLGDCDLVIRTAAVHDGNPEIAGAVARGIPVYERAQAWGAIMQRYPNALCVSGTHGKTTTTSMCTHIFMAAHADPTVMIGGTLPLLHAGYRVGHGDTIIMESCEYCNSFLSFYPTVAVILNVEEDHLDFFKDLRDIEHSFRKFAQLVPPVGHIIANADNDGAMEALADLGRPVFTFGLDRPADCTAANLVEKDGHPSFDVMIQGEFYAHVDLQLYGRHNVLDALAAASSAFVLGIPGKAVEEGLASFTGAGRRFEYKGTYHGAQVYDDYAHHPDELHALMTAARKMNPKRLILAFQPHTYTRTAKLFDRFVEELKQADVAILAEIFAAREQNTLGISSADLCRNIPGSVYCSTLDKVTEQLRSIAQPGDLILTVGAGDIYRAGEKLLQSEA